ncbi:hypothetical protein BJV82DRAFT_585741 [Fennellomyces sp. T-0311]|nr:hypothetical protein BJV82DRAFT_585741 [Fennellomyces sp. T-0311]
MSSVQNKEFFAGVDRRYSIQDTNGTILVTASEYLSTASIAQWLQQSPNATATLTLDGGDTIDLPVYALRRRNGVVANHPEAPHMTT